MNRFAWRHGSVLVLSLLGIPILTGARAQGCSTSDSNEGCVAGGCSGHLCLEEGEDLVSTCEWLEEYACYKQHGVCSRNAQDECAWEASQALQDCIVAARRTPVSSGCIRNAGDACTRDEDCAAGGCGGELCHNPAVSEGSSTCDCTAPQNVSCGCVSGTCTWWQ